MIDMKKWDPKAIRHKLHDIFSPNSNERPSPLRIRWAARPRKGVTMLDLHSAVVGKKVNMDVLL